MLTKEKVLTILYNFMTVCDSVKWNDSDDNVMTYWCEVTFRISPHTSVLAFCFDKDRNLIPSMTGGPNLQQLAEYNAAYSRALAIISALELKQF